MVNVKNIFKSSDNKEMVTISVMVDKKEEFLVVDRELYEARLIFQEINRKNIMVSEQNLHIGKAFDDENEMNQIINFIRVTNFIRMKDNYTSGNRYSDLIQPYKGSTDLGWQFQIPGNINTTKLNSIINSSAP